MTRLRLESGTRRTEPTGDRAEAVLIDRLREGDRHVLNDLLPRYWNAVVGYADAIVESRDAAQDVAQETFIKLWDHRSEWESGDSLRPLLFRIARNLALNARRTTRRRAVRALAAVGLRVDRAETPDELLEASDLQQAVAQAIRSLPPRRRETFWLARYEGLSYREIGEIMSISPQTVANHLSMATAELRVLLRPLIE